MIKNTNTTQTSILGTIQHILGMLIGGFLLLSLIPTVYQDIYQATIGLILIQIILSLIRLRIINLVLEIIILILALISIIPILISVKIIAIPLAILVYLLRIIALIIALIDSSSQNSPVVFAKMNLNNMRQKKEKPQKSKKLKDLNIQDAEFKEK
ncbi:MAG: hypothetical protein PF569_00740 [Candidatus Woesearchaeota archaeon]|jgi:predicted membrane protein|nr:hypothetical protein [Candidatus Woesearchaeota archaeon]